MVSARVAWPPVVKWGITGITIIEVKIILKGYGKMVREIVTRKIRAVLI